jgi:mono/diheme cytochrome c family protein
MLVFGLTVQRSSADELPNLKDPTMISAGHALFLEKQCAHCHGEDGAGGVNLTRRILDAKGRIRFDRRWAGEKRHPHAGMA